MAFSCTCSGFSSSFMGPDLQRTLYQHLESWQKYLPACMLHDRTTSASAASPVDESFYDHLISKGLFPLDLP